jgi:hypothetical protein
MANADPPSVRIQNSFRQLAAAAANLNSISDELGKPIEQLDADLKRLNLGVTTWKRILGDRDEFTDVWWSQDIGYDKIGGKWGIALRRRSGDGADPDAVTEEAWLFNDAPRWLRIIGIDHVATVIEGLVAEAINTTEQIKKKVNDAQSVAVAVHEIVSLPRQK